MMQYTFYRQMPIKKSTNKPAVATLFTVFYKWRSTKAFVRSQGFGNSPNIRSAFVFQREFYYICTSNFRASCLK